MADLFDYLRWRGDLPLTQAPLNPVDNLILSNLSYIHFDGLLSSDLHHPKTLKQFKQRRQHTFPYLSNDDSCSAARKKKASNKTMYLI